MANKASTQLHELIHSMTGAEKRYFKLMATLHQTRSPKNYVRLFDVIEGQAEYDEEIVREHFRTETFLNHLTIAKNRLYHQLLRSLDAFHLDSSAEADLNRQLHYAEILFAKMLYSQCERILNRTLKSAFELQKWPIVLQILKKKKRLAEIHHYERNAGDEIDDIHSEEKNALNMLAGESELWRIKSKVSQRIIASGQVRNEKELEAFVPEMREMEEMESSGELSFEATYLALHTQSAYYFAAGDYENCIEILLKTKALIEENFNLVKDEPGIYISVLTNLIYTAAKLNRFEVVEDTMKLTRNLPGGLTDKLTDDLRYRVFVNTYSLELAIANLKGDADRTEQLTEEIKEGFAIWESKMSEARKASFYHGLSTLHFLSGEVKKALEENNKLLNSISIDKTEDQYVFAQIFHLVLHVELGNSDLLPYGLKSLKRYLDLRDRKFAFENYFVSLVRAISSSGEDAQRKKAFEEFLRGIKPLENEPYEKVAFEYFDFISWAVSKIEDRDYAQVLRERIPEKNVL